MESVYIVLVVVLLLAVLGLLLYLLSLKLSLRETSRELDEKLKTDTNTLVSISSGKTMNLQIVDSKKTEAVNLVDKVFA